MKAPFLESNSLQYEPLSPVHLSERYVSWLNDPEVNKFTFSRLDTTMASLQNYLENLVANPILFWAIHIKSSHEHIGNIKIDPINEEHGFGEYGIMIGERSQWGKGYAFEASQAIIDYCFNKLNLRKINLHVGAQNDRGVRLYFNLGFHLEGILKSHFKYRYGYDDVIRMAILNPANLRDGQ